MIELGKSARFWRLFVFQQRMLRLYRNINSPDKKNTERPEECNKHAVAIVQRNSFYDSQIHIFSIIWSRKLSESSFKGYLAVVYILKSCKNCDAGYGLG